MIFGTITKIAKRISNLFSKYGILSVVIPLMLLATIIYNVFYIHYEQIPLLDVIYFNIVTAATVGYGDVCPKTPQGRFATILYLPVIVSLFAIVAGTLGAAILDRIERKKLGMKKTRRSFDILILGGYAEKIDALVKEIHTHSHKSKICVMTDQYSRLSDFFTMNHVHWIDGNITDDSAFELIELEKVKSVIVLSSNPVEKSSDAKIFNTYSVLRSAPHMISILVETVRGDFSCFPQDESISYLQVCGADMIAKEYFNHGSSYFLSALCNNSIPGDQGNTVCSESTNWLSICDNLWNASATPLGFHLPGTDTWKFFPTGDPVIPSGSTIKYATMSDMISSKPITAKVLLITNNSKRVLSFAEDYFSDQRFDKSEIVVLTNSHDEPDFLHNSVRFIHGDGTDERVLRSESLKLNEFTNVIIMADWGNPNSDDHACLQFNIIRNFNPHARIVVEVISTALETLYQKMYDNSDLTFFTGLSNTRVLVQEVQDFGFIELLQKINCSKSSITYNEETIPHHSGSWSKLQKMKHQQEGKYVVGFFDANSKNWAFDPILYERVGCLQNNSSQNVTVMSFHN